MERHVHGLEELILLRYQYSNTPQLIYRFKAISIKNPS